MGDCRISVCTSCAKQDTLESCGGTTDLAIVVGGLHFEDVRDDAVNGHVSN